MGKVELPTKLTLPSGTVVSVRARDDLDPAPRRRAPSDPLKALGGLNKE